MTLISVHRKKLTLRKDLGLFSATAAGVGIIVGAGVYVLIGSAAGLAGNSVWLSFLISSLVALFTGLSYAELSSMYQDDASEFLYTEKAFGKFLGFLVAYFVILSGIIAAAAVSLGFAGYFSKLFHTGNSYTLLIIAALAIILFSYINYRSIKESARLNIIFTGLELLGLLLIIIAAYNYYGTVNYFDFSNGFSGIFNAAALIFFAFIGFESIVKLSEETEHAKKIIPKALVLSILITTIIYVLVGVAAISVVPWDQLATSKAPLADVAQALLGQKAFVLLSIIALFSTGNTILFSLITTSRIMYGTAKRFSKLAFLRAVSKTTATPIYAILITGILALLFILLKNINFVAEITNFAIFITFILVNLSLIVLRYKLPNKKRIVRVPGTIGTLPILPAIGILTSVGMLISLDWRVLLGGVVLTMIGILLYWLLARK